VTTAQLLAAGLTRRQIHNLVTCGALRRLHRGVYALGHVAPNDKRRWMAAVLATDPVGALTGHSAARLLGVSRRRKDRTHVLTSRVRRSRRGITATFAHDLTDEDTFVYDDIRITKLGWILLTMAPDSTVGELTRAIREYAHHHDLDVEELRRFVSSRQGHPNIDLVRRACHDLFATTSGGTDSEFEDDLGAALREAFPDVTWITNMRVPRAGDGSYRLDFYCPEAPLCVEGDPAHHRLVINRLDDLKRDAELDQRGIPTIRIDADAFRADPTTAFLPVASRLAHVTNGAHAVTFVR
jgi:very-short-patch-repair endonuclease